MKKKKNLQKKNSSGIKKIDFIGQILIAFCEVYEEYHGMQYEVVSEGKERSMAGKLLRLYKGKYPKANSEETIEGLKAYFWRCVRIRDPWLNRNMSIPIIINQFNQINNILKNGNTIKQKGATNQEFIKAIQKGFDRAKNR